MEESKNKIQSQSKIKKIAANIDIFSVQTSFYFEKQENFTTIFGGVLSIFFLILCIYFTFTNQAFYKSGINIVQMSQQSAGFTYSLNGKDYPIGINFLDANKNKINIGNNFTITFNCIRQNSAQVKISTSVLATAKKCDYFGEYCLDANSQCQIYQKATLQSQYITIDIKYCDSSVPNCNLTFIEQYFNQFYLSLSYLNFEPNQDQMNWKNTSRTMTTHMYINYSMTRNVIFTKQIFVTNNQFFGSLGLFSKSLYGLKQQTQNIPTGSIVSNKMAYGGKIASYVLTSSNSILLLNQNFFDLSGLITYYFSIYGVFMVLIGLFLKTYTNNLLYISLGNYFKYAINQKKKIISFKQTNLKTFIFGLTFFQTFQKYYPKFYIKKFEYHIKMRKVGCDKLNIDNLLMDIHNLNKDQQQNRIVKLTIKNEQKKEQEQTLDQNQISQKLREQLQKNIKTRSITENEIQAFLMWAQINNYTVQQGKQVIKILFLNQTNDNYTQNIKNEFEQFKIVSSKDKYEDIHCALQKDSQLSDIKLNYSHNNSGIIAKEIRFKKTNLNGIINLKQNKQIISLNQNIDEVKI